MNRRRLNFGLLCGMIALFAVILSACQPQVVEVEKEVTRVVTETETVIEEVEVTVEVVEEVEVE
ncbi:MAG: hypothetical protein AAF633_21670, partial [Chloroflexota bacterium]